MITYKQQFDKLTSAYIRGEVNPYKSCGCFVGNLLNNKSGWGLCRNVYREISNINKSLIDMALNIIQEEAEGFYTLQEILDLEKVFMSYVSRWSSSLLWISPTEEMENALFIAFESTLELLKQIHISKGEIIDEVPTFVKRKQLCNA